jgi:hypothetical protein|tara:strand:- start:146 stop:376 length:231 start_codon:yes stop_codon:yes gene_type:complete
MKNLKRIPKLALLLAASSASLVLLLEPIATKLILAAISFAGVFWLTRDWRLPKGLWRTNKSQQKQNEGEKKQWFPY